MPFNPRIQSATDLNFSRSFILAYLYNGYVKLGYKFFVRYRFHNYKFQAVIFEEEKPRGDIKHKVLGGK